MSEAAPAPTESRRRKLLYRATHRGTKENDLLIGDFVARHIGSFCAAELDALEQLLEWPENDLADWLTGRRRPPPEADTPMLRRIRDAAA